MTVRKRPAKGTGKKTEAGRVKSSNALQESEEKYRLLIEATNTGYVIIDEQGRVLDANEEYVKLTGHGSLAEIAGRAVTEWTAAYDQERNAAEVRKCMESGSVRNLVIDYVAPTCRVTPVEINATVLRAPRAPRIFTVCRDITERKQAREELAGQKAMLQQILDTASVAIFLVDKAGRITQANRRMAEMFGRSMEELAGSEYVSLVHPSERETGRKNMLALLASEISSVDLERHYWRRDGTEFWGHLAGRRFYDVHGNELGLIGVISDITERKRAEDALKESKRSLETLMSNLPGMAYRCRNDRDWTMEYVNEGALELTGYQQADLVGNAKIAYNDLIHPDDQEAVWEAVQKAVGSRDKYTLNYRIRTADGTEKWVWEQGQGVFSEAGDLLALEGFITDITERQLLEEERLKTQKLESIGTLAGGIAHDFNNLLQGIFGYISMAKLTLDQKEKSLAMLEQAEKALHQSVNLTSQLLTFSKGGKPVKKTVDLRAVIENAVKFALSGSRIDYDLSFEADLSAVEADEGQIGRVVQNIVLNAEQAMPLGGRIEIAARNVPATRAAGLPLSAPDGLVEIVVRDRGTGIPPGHLPRIFDPYFTTKERRSGLGLATSYSIVKNHDGLIDVRSEVGKGSIFTIYLPAVEAERTEVQALPVASAGRRGRVLVMDDEEIVRMVAGELIRSLGHEAEFAEHGDAAIEKYKQAKAEGRPFDVVILDLTIRGGKGGEETLRELLEIDPGVKAVVSSGYSDDEVVATYRQHGFRFFLKKPYSIGELRMMLDDVMA